METTNHHRIWRRKPCLVFEICDNSSHREDDEPDEEMTKRMSDIHILPESLNGSKYLVLPEFLQRILAIVQQNVWFMPDGVPQDFSIAVHNHLHATYSRKWIGRDRLVAWPPHSQSFGFLLLWPPEIAYV
ncbi:hypothetical protein TNCV_1152121 [Trichonephila clavipes]|nr:hypothetical protein TNCV_1152121 [Trichonephila clavipes]